VGGPVSRRRIATSIVIALVVIALAIAITSWLRGVVAHPGGDPGGRLVAKLAPVVRVVPGFQTGHVPWISFPCDSCEFPVTYAIKIEPRWDSCDGRAGTFGGLPPL
jgi:hypothetical protein